MEKEPITDKKKGFPGEGPDHRRWWEVQWVVRVIGATKLLKAVLTLVVAIEAFRLIHGDVEAILEHWVQIIRVDPDNYYVHGLLEKIFALKPSTLRAISAGSFLYFALYTLEGVGLILDKMWAEWLTVGTTAGFIPLEIIHLSRGIHPLGVGVFIFNLLVLAYLLARLAAQNRRRMQREDLSQAG
jgi:uncharacterized membrane protein (DUF2068 family)